MSEDRAYEDSFPLCTRIHDRLLAHATHTLARSTSFAGRFGTERKCDQGSTVAEVVDSDADLI